MIETNKAIECADIATILGNEFTISTYNYAKKPMYRIPISAPSTYSWDESKDFDNCKKKYLCFGSGGFVHKGLDLVLEAFTNMPVLQPKYIWPIGTGKRVCESLSYRTL